MVVVCLLLAVVVTVVQGTPPWQHPGFNFAGFPSAQTGGGALPGFPAPPQSSFNGFPAQQQPAFQSFPSQQNGFSGFPAPQQSFSGFQPQQSGLGGFQNSQQSNVFSVPQQRQQSCNCPAQQPSNCFNQVCPPPPPPCPPPSPCPAAQVCSCPKENCPVAVTQTPLLLATQPFYETTPTPSNNVYSQGPAASHQLPLAPGQPVPPSPLSPLQTLPELVTAPAPTTPEPPLPVDAQTGAPLGPDDYDHYEPASSTTTITPESFFDVPTAHVPEIGEERRHEYQEGEEANGGGVPEPQAEYDHDPNTDLQTAVREVRTAKPKERLGAFERYEEGIRQRPLRVFRYAQRKQFGAPTLTTHDKGRCNSLKLKVIMLESIETSPTVSKRRIQKEAANELGGVFDVICSKHDFSYVVNTRIFCETRVEDIVCFAFMHARSIDQL